MQGLHEDRILQIKPRQTKVMSFKQKLQENNFAVLHGTANLITVIYSSNHKILSLIHCTKEENKQTFHIS